MMQAQALLGRLQKRRLLVKTRRRGMQKGIRRSSSFGSSLEFSDFRQYQPGDDVRQIDWNVYGRTQKHYIKRFLDEQELVVSIYLDATSSMRCIPEKWDRAKQIAAAFSYLVLAGEDRLSFIPVAVTTNAYIRRKGAVYGKPVFQEIMQLSELDSTSSFVEQLGQQFITKAQVAVIITDGLEPLEQYEAMFKKIASFKQEIKFIQLVSYEELDPLYDGDMKFIDSETNEYVNVSMNATVIQQYKERVMAHNEQLELLCKRYGIHYMLTTDRRDLQAFLFQDCTAKGWL